MEEKSPDRLELSWGRFRAYAAGTLAVSGLLAIVFVLVVLGVLQITKASSIKLIDGEMSVRFEYQPEQRDLERTQSN